MACNKCGRGKCRCKKVTIFDDRPEVVKVNNIPVPGQPGEPGEDGDTYIPEIDDNFFDI